MRHERFASCASAASRWVMLGVHRVRIEQREVQRRTRGGGSVPRSQGRLLRSLMLACIDEHGLDPR